MAITLHFDTSSMERAIRRLRSRVPRLEVRALNRSATSGRATLARHVSQDTGLNVSDVKDFITIEKATVDRKVAVVRASAKRVPLIKFRASGPEPSRGRGRGVSARVQGDRKRYPHAFIATMKSGHRGVFERKGRSRSRKGMPWGSPGLPIRQLFGPSIYHVAQKHVAVAQARFQEQLEKNMAHEFEYAFREQEPPALWDDVNKTFTTEAQE